MVEYISQDSSFMGEQFSAAYPNYMALCESKQDSQSILSFDLLSF